MKTTVEGLREICEQVGIDQGGSLGELLARLRLKEFADEEMAGDAGADLESSEEVIEMMTKDGSMEVEEEATANITGDHVERAGVGFRPPESVIEGDVSCVSVHDKLPEGPTTEKSTEEVEPIEKKDGCTMAWCTSCQIWVEWSRWVCSKNCPPAAVGATYTQSAAKQRCQHCKHWWKTESNGVTGEVMIRSTYFHKKGESEACELPPSAKLPYHQLADCCEFIENVEKAEVDGMCVHESLQILPSGRVFFCIKWKGEWGYVEVPAVISEDWTI